MSRWFRLYDELLDDPKAQRLPPADFKAWVNLLCLASRHDGKLPPIADIAFALRMDENAIVTVLERLAIATLIDKHNGGVDGFHYIPHGWAKRQYKSDNSTDRSNKSRAKKRNVAATLHATAPETEADTDTDTDNLEAKASSGSDEPSEGYPSNSDGSDEQALKPEHFVEAWNDLAQSLGKPKIRTLTPERRVQLKSRIAGYSLDDFREVLGNVEQSPFLRGDKGWSGCTFDWVIKKANFQKILEGNYNV